MIRIAGGNVHGRTSSAPRELWVLRSNRTVLRCLKSCLLLVLLLLVLLMLPLLMLSLLMLPLLMLSLLMLSLLMLSLLMSLLMLSLLMSSRLMPLLMLSLLMSLLMSATDHLVRGGRLSTPAGRPRRVQLEPELFQHSFQRQRLAGLLVHHDHPLIIINKEAGQALRQLIQLVLGERWLANFGS